MRRCARRTAERPLLGPTDTRISTEKSAWRQDSGEHRMPFPSSLLLRMALPSRKGNRRGAFRVMEAEERDRHSISSINPEKSHAQSM